MPPSPTGADSHPQRHPPDGSTSAAGVGSFPSAPTDNSPTNTDNRPRNTSLLIRTRSGYAESPRLPDLPPTPRTRWCTADHTRRHLISVRATVPPSQSSCYDEGRPPNRFVDMMYSTGAPKVFLSFAMEHKMLVDLFRSQARNGRSGIVFLDYSIKDPVDGGWQIHAECLIRASTTTICLVGETTWRSEPVNWEIRRSVELGKRVLAVYLQSNAARLPTALADAGITPLPWDIQIIANSLCYERR